MFRTMLSSGQRQRLEALQREVLRLHGLSDLWLGRAIVDLSREVRRSDDAGELLTGTYDCTLIWSLAPELARRLGYGSLQAQELNAEMMALSNEALRQRLGVTLFNVGRRFSSQAWQLLTRDPVNGNPLAIAMDRLRPGNPKDPLDRIAVHTAEVAHYRGVDYDGVWSPQLLGRQ